MKIKKILLTGLIGLNFSLITVFNHNSVPAQSTDVVYKAFAKRLDFDDKYFNYQWSLDNDGSLKYSDQYGGKTGKQQTNLVEAVKDVDIDFPEARAKFSGGRQETIVAIIDTGVDYKHEDLKDVLWVNKGEIPGNEIDDDNNGYVDDVNGWNFYDDNNVLYNGKDDTHGTHIAGTIIANINSKGVAGVAGSSNVKIMVLKALGGEDESGLTAGIAEAIVYAEKMGAVICNFSFGTDKNDKYLEETIRDSKMLFVVASGNGDEDNGLGYDIDSRHMYPASYGYDNIISVANLQADGRLHPSSNYSYNSVDLAAPGSRILSTIDSEAFNSYVSGRLPTPYAYMTGTSMAAPFVSGTAALIYSDFPGLTPAQVKQSIVNGSKSLPFLVGKVATEGMLSAEGAYNYAGDNYQSFLNLTKKAEKGKNSVIVKTSPSLKIYRTPAGKILVRLNDKNKEVADIRYAKGKKSSAYFKKGKMGIKLNLNSKNEKTLKLKKGSYTFCIIDKQGKRILKRVAVK